MTADLSQDFYASVAANWALWRWQWQWQWQAGSLGLAAIFNISEVALLAIKYLGVAYLFYMA